MLKMQCENMEQHAASCILQKLFVLLRSCAISAGYNYMLSCPSRCLCSYPLSDIQLYRQQLQRCSLLWEENLQARWSKQLDLPISGTLLLFWGPLPCWGCTARHVLVMNAIKESIKYSRRVSSMYSIAETVLKFMQSKRCINGFDGISAFLAVSERLVLAVSIMVTSSSVLAVLLWCEYRHIVTCLIGFLHRHPVLCTKLGSFWL